MKFFDEYGWAVSEDNGRKAAFSAPEGYTKTVGQPYPNWTGTEWVIAAYNEPDKDVLAKTIRRGEIVNRLAEIDKSSFTPRAHREIACGNLAWVQSLEDEAQKLRAELKALKS